MTHLKLTKGAILDNIKRLKNSKNGNPRYELTFNGLGFTANTKSDSSYAYKICDHWQGKPVIVEYHITSKGNIAIDDLELVQ